MTEVSYESMAALFTNGAAGIIFAGMLVYTSQK